MSDSLRDEIDRSTIRLLLQEPFYGHYVLGLRKEITEAAPGIAVSIDDGAACLKIAPSYWNGLSEAQRLGAFKHEMLHLVFRHPLRRSEFGDPTLFNLCADLVVNQHLLLSQLREDDCTLADFDGLEADRTVEWYYARLLDRLHSSDETGGTAIKQQLDPEVNAQERHRPWASVGALDSLQRNLLESSLDAHLSATMDKVHDWSEIPGQLGRLLAQRAGRAASLNWRRLLRLFASTASTTWLKDTIHRPSKRYRTVPGFKVKPRQRLVVVLDTSASIGAEELEAFVSEMRHIWRTGAQVEVIECDAAVKRTYHFRGKPPQNLAGGGGTSFDPALELANRLMPDALVYLTDGIAPAPTVAPRYPILWMMTPRGLSLDDDRVRQLPGRKAHLREPSVVP